LQTLDSSVIKDLLGQLQRIARKLTRFDACRFGHGFDPTCDAREPALRSIYGSKLIQQALMLRWLRAAGKLLLAV